MKNRKYFEEEIDGFFTQFFLNGKNLALSIRIQDYEGFKFKRNKKGGEKYGSRRR